MTRTRNHSCHLLDQVHEKETDHQEGIKGPEEAEGEGNKDGNHQGCRMWATVLGEAIMVVEEAITEVDVVDTEGNKLEEEDTEGRTEEMDPRVKVDGNHVGGTMDLPHLVDLDPGVHPGGNEPRHLPDVDHLVHHLDVEIHPHLEDGMIHPLHDDETIPHLEGDVLMTRHLDDPLLREGVGTTIPHPGELGMIHLQSGGSETILPHPQPERSETTPPLLENSKRMIHPQEDVETIHHLVELLGEIHPGPDPGRGHLPSPLHVDAEEVRAEAGVERGRPHLKLGGGEVLPHLHLVQMLRTPRWISQIGMGMATLR
jgi:hypothetical protein